MNSYRFEFWGELVSALQSCETSFSYSKWDETTIPEYTVSTPVDNIHP